MDKQEAPESPEDDKKSKTIDPETTFQAISMSDASEVHDNISFRSQEEKNNKIASFSIKN